MTDKPKKQPKPPIPQTMFCSKCGTPIPLQGNTCPKCGFS